MLSIIICTYNRSDVLGYCLEALAKDGLGSVVPFEVLVVDNNSTDSTRQVAESFRHQFPEFHYFVEEEVGLSHARNRGYRKAHYDWVIYLDDDAKVQPGFMKRLIWFIKTYGFDGFGGRCYPWYLEPKPKWIPEDFGLMPLFLKEPGRMPDNRCVQGMVMGFRKSALQAVHGFPSNLGMTGTQVGYGEEIWVQEQMRKQSFVIGFDPELKVDHLVAPYKYTLRWHFKRQFAKGKEAAILGKVRSKNKVLNVLWALLVTVKHATFNLYKLVFQRNYYYQNYLLGSFGFFVKTMGIISVHE